MMEGKTMDLTIAFWAMITGFLTWGAIAAVGVFHALSAVEWAFKPWVRRRL